MRPRINSFGKISYKEIDKFLYENNVYSHTVKRNENTMIYTYFIMFRNLKRKPEMLMIEVSRNSGNVICACTDRGNKFPTIDDLKRYVKIKW